MDEDRDLKARFQALRAEDESRAPSFARVLSIRRRRAPALAWALAGACAMAIAFTLGWQVHERIERRRVSTAVTAWQDLAVDSWGRPTEFLLATPASDIMNGMPDLGSSTFTDSLDVEATPTITPGADSARRTQS